LQRRAKAGDFVGGGEREAVTDVVVAAAAFGGVVERVLRNVGEVAGGAGGVDRVRVGVAGEQV